MLSKRYFALGGKKLHSVKALWRRVCILPWTLCSLGLANVIGKFKGIKCSWLQMVCRNSNLYSFNIYKERRKIGHLPLVWAYGKTPDVSGNKYNYREQLISKHCNSFILPFIYIFHLCIAFHLYFFIMPDLPGFSNDF